MLYRFKLQKKGENKERVREEKGESRRKKHEKMPTPYRTTALVHRAGF